VAAHTNAELDEAIRHVGYELWMMASAAGRFRSGHGDGVTQNAYQESMLLHARALADFLVLERGYDTDIRRTDFAPQWQPQPEDAADRVRTHARRLDKYLAHLTWERTDPESAVWDYDIAADLLSIADRWGQHLRDSRPDLYDPFLAHIVWARNALNNTGGSAAPGAT
jgi:hypothetical protein